ncbi:acetyl-CoA synthetase-like protein [Apiospora aurea]|uniref:Acetyl-CoA synthetase-like protein n=1 Tax=Apiospora aurea TaxID=335848 RepID=A0ABR1PWV4_9PEZI
MDATAAVSFDEASLSQLAATADRATRRNLIVSLRRMADSLEDTTGTIHKFAHLDLERAMIQIGYDLNIFTILVDAGGVKTAEDLAKDTGADPELIKRIMRYYNTINVAREVGPYQYVATNTTKNLVSDVCKAAMGHFWGLVSKEYQALPEFLKTNGPPWKIMLEVPNAMDDFHQYMALRRDATLSWLSVYPVREVTAGLTDPQRPLYVNVGGGIGHQCAEFRAQYPDIPGRVINQDLPETVERGVQAEGLEHMAHDFFQPQPVKGAKIYYMRGVPHDHPPHKVHVLFRQIADAMVPDSVLLVDETVLPATGVSHIAACVDLTMMGIASMERTEAEWRSLAESAGLELVRSYTYNALENETVMELRLARGEKSLPSL